MKTLVTLLAISSLSFEIWAGPQVAWIQRYNAGRTKGTNQAVVMALDSQGNIIVAGSSRGTLGDFDYVVLKYTPAGSNGWVRRYTSAGESDDQVRAIYLDRDDNIHVTGTSVTLKYDPAGAPLWTAPYGGHALAGDTNGNVYVTGYLTNDFATVKLSSMGSNHWERTHDMIGQNDVSHQVIVDADGNSYVAGPEVWAYDNRTRVNYQRFRVVSYTPEGSVRFSTFIPNAYRPTPSNVRGLYLAGDALILTGNLNVGGGLGLTFCTVRVELPGGASHSFGNWVGNPDIGETASIQSPNGDIFLTGGMIFNFFHHSRYRTLRVRSDQLTTNGEGTAAWQSDYVGPNPGENFANAIGLDGVGNVYVAGQSAGATTQADALDWATIKYSSDGKQQWVQRYNGPAKLNDAATCMAVTSSGEVYAAGWSQTSQSLTELIVIKYADLENIQVQPDKRASLQFFGTPGQNYRIDAATNLLQWESLGSFIADPAGIYRYVDTNAPDHPWRFYRTERVWSPGFSR